MASLTTTTTTESLQTPIHPNFTSKLDEDFVEYYNANISNKKATHGVSIEDIRAHPEKYASPWFRDFSGEPFVHDLSVSSVDGFVFTVRCYQPDPATSVFGQGPYPVHINYHGGGFTFGGLLGDAALCKLVRDRTGVMVLDVDYRLCPGSISAGGNMYAILQQLARDAEIPLKLAFLGVPTVASHAHLEKPEDSPFPSMAENSLAPTLGWSRLVYFRSLCIPKNEEEKAALDARGPFFVEPIDGRLTGLCPTFVATAAADPLRDEGEAYAQRLMQAGVLTTVRRYTGVPHPFMHMRPIKKALMYEDDLCNAVQLAHTV